MTITQVAPGHLMVRKATVRRRQILLGLVGLALLAALLAMGTGSLVAWAAMAVLLVAMAGYLVVVHRSRTASFERGFASLRAPGEVSLDTLEEARLTAERGPESDLVVSVVIRPTSVRHALALARFAVSYAAGWALSPVVFALTIAVGRTPKDTAGQRWLANIQSAQEKMREQSLRTLAISAATTASVTAAGSVAVFGGAGVATAAPITASASIGTNAGVGVTTAAPSTTRYVVVDGDTLWGIALKFGTTISALGSANHITDPNLVYAGQVLVIPGGTGGSSGASSPTSTVQSGSSGTYTVLPGDTLSAIAARFGTTVAAIASASHITDPNLITVGEVLSIPGAGGAATSTPTTSTPTTTPTTATRTVSGTETYTVQPGDTLSAIAARFGTTVSILVATNHIANPNVITVGEVLVIRGGSGSSGATTTATTTPTTTTSTTTTSTPAATGAAEAVQVALAQVGKPYVWAGAGPNDYDCSGLVMYAWEHAGVDLPHYTVSQYDDTTRISESQLAPGDLVFYDTGAGAQPGHVTMYIGNGQVVTADEPGTDVRVESITWDGTPMGFGRVS